MNQTLVMFVISVLGLCTLPIDEREDIVVRRNNMAILMHGKKVNMLALWIKAYESMSRMTSDV